MPGQRGVWVDELVRDGARVSLRLRVEGGAGAVEIAYRQGWIGAAELEALAAPLVKSGYGQYLLAILRDRVF